MHYINKALKENLNIYILFSIIIIGLVISYLNLSFTFNISLTSKNQKAAIAQDKLNKFPKGLLLISMKNQDELSENEILKIIQWLDDSGKSESTIKLKQNTLTININYSEDFDLANYLNKLFLIPNKKIQNLKIINKERLIKIELV